MLTNSVKKYVGLFGNKKLRFLMNEEYFTTQKIITDFMILPLLEKKVTFVLEITSEFITIFITIDAVVVSDVF